MTEQDDKSAEFDDLDELLLDALAAGLTHEQAGALFDISAKTVQRRRRRPAFRREQARRRAEVLEARTAQVLAASELAVPTIVASLQSDNESIRLRSAQLLLEFARRLAVDLASDDLRERLLDLEDEVGEIRRGGGLAKVVIEGRGEWR